jgi:hypothetical protein
VRGLNLSKIQLELLVSRSQGWNLLQQEVKISHRKGQQLLSSFFSPRNGKLVYCNVVEGLLQELGCAHNSEVWRRFVDSSTFILKTVQQINGNIHPSIPISHSVHKKETYENNYLLLKTICYPKCDWKICGDLTVLCLLLGMQHAYMKICCFLCECKSLAEENITKLRMAH